MQTQHAITHIIPLKRLAFLFTAIISVLGFTGCTQQNQPTQQTFYVFGTAVQVEIVETPHDKAQLAIQNIEAMFQQFNRDWHAWEKGGILAKINQAIREQQPIEVRPSIQKFILKSQKLAQKSDNLFDPGIGKLVRMWGFLSEDWKGPPPSQAKINHWLKHRPSIQNIYFKGNQLYSTNPDVWLDFGGNAKGLALDLAIESLQQSGIQNAIVNIGGDMRIIGDKNPEKHQAWKIGIQDPFDPKKVIASLALEGDESVVTSGNYQRYFIWKGKHYSHILNPNTGYPADTFVSVTVLHQDATTADAAATALMVAGPKEWQTIAQQMGINEAFMIDPNGKTYITPTMAKRLTVQTP